MPRYSYMIIESDILVNQDPQPFFDLIKTTGYEGVELNLTPALIDNLDSIEKAAQNSGLAIPSFLTGTAYNEGLCLSVPDADIRQRTAQRLIDYLTIARRFDAILVVGLLQGFRSDEPDPQIANQRIAATLAQVGAAAQDQGVDLVVEPINHLQVGFNNSVGEVRQLVEAIGSPAFGPMIDTIHMNIEETSLTQPIYACGAKLRHVHLCESNGSVLGSGHIDFKAVLKALAEIDYKRFASIKVYRNATHQAAIVDSMEHLRQQTPA